MDINIIVDTNIVSGPKSYGKLFGNRKMLALLAGLANVKIIIPSMVLREVLAQKERSLEIEKDRISNNPLLGFALDKNSFERIYKAEIDSYTLEYNESQGSIPFQKIEIPESDKGRVLDEISSLAIGKKLPFDPSDNTDKGFKDAYIAKEIEYSLETLSGYTFFSSNDNLLSLFFYSYPNIDVVNSLDKILDRLTIECNIVTNVKNKDSKVASTEQYIVEYSRIVNFKDTHNAIRKLNSVRKQITPRLKSLILLLSASNNQVMWIAEDPDVKDFLEFLLTKYDKKLISEYRVSSIKNQLQSY